MDIAQVLYNSILSPDPDARAQAESYMREAEANHFVEYLAALTQQLGNESQKTEVRMLAALELKNSLAAKDMQRKMNNRERWLSLDSSAKQQIKSTALQALLSQDERVASAAAQLIAAIADIELPRNEWPDLFQVLIHNTSASSPVHVKKASLTAIGFICETADPTSEAVTSQSDGILTAIVQGARKEESSAIVRGAALNALVLSLDFARKNFKNQTERDFIMQVICEATQSPDSKVQLIAFAALNKVMALYYSVMQPYMAPALFPLTATAMQKNDEGVVMMALEFWATICEEEIAIKYAGEEEGIEVWGQSYNFAEQAIPTIIPQLLRVMTEQDEDASEDEWNSAMSAASTLSLFAQCCGDAVVGPTVSFVSDNIQSEKWNLREAAVMAFGSILDGPSRDPLKQLIGQALSPILALITDQSLAVKDTVSWCLGRITDLVVDGIDPQTQLPELMKALVTGLQDSPRVATNCCWALINLNEQIQESPEKDESIMSPYYEVLFPALIQASSRPDNENSCRTSAYEALSSLIVFSTNDAMNTVWQLSTVVIERLQQTLSVMEQFARGLPTPDDRNNLEELQLSLLGLLTSIVRRVSSEVASGAESVMRLCLLLLEHRLPNSLIDEDVFVLVGTVAGAINEKFNVFVDAFMPYLINALKQSDSSISHTAVGLVSDLYIAVGKDMERYAQVIMDIFIENISKPVTYPKLKPSTLSCIGDIAGYTGTSFEPFLQVTMNVLQEASSLRADSTSPPDFVDYVISLMRSIVDAYAGIVTGMADKPQLLLPYIAQIFGFLSYAVSEEEIVKSSDVVSSIAGIIGDIAELYPNGQVKELFNNPWLAEFFKQVRNSSFYTEKAVATVKWARERARQQRSLPQA